MNYVTELFGSARGLMAIDRETKRKGSTRHEREGQVRQLFLLRRLLLPVALVCISVSGCMSPPKSFDNHELRARFEKEFAERELDPIEGFWRSANEYTEGVGVTYKIDPAENAGFPFATRGIRAHQKVALPHHIDEEDFNRVGARLKPTPETGVYIGEARMVRGRQKYWEDITVRIIDPTTIETTINSSTAVLGGRTQRSYLAGPKQVLDRRLQAVANLKKAKPSPDIRPPDNRKGPAVFSSGSGFLVADDLVVSNYHVVEDAQELSCAAGGKTVSLTLIAQDRTNDLALLRCAERLANPAARLFHIGDSGSVRHGRKVYAMGYPLPEVLGKDLHVHEGIISSLTGFQGSSAEYQIEMSVNPGNSGGPLVDQRGIVVGVVASKLGATYARRTGTIPEGVSFAVKSEFVRTLAHSAGVGDQIRPSSGNEVELSLEELIAAYGDAVVRIEAR